jgi:hypothetical protein
MNRTIDGNITINVTGQLTVSRASLKELLREALVEIELPAKPIEAAIPAEKGFGRKAFNTREVAEMLNCCSGTVYRLIRRGLLRRSMATRTIMVSSVEIERFLRETTKSEWQP